MKGEEEISLTKDEYICFAKDIIMFDQNACSSPKVVILVTKTKINMRSFLHAYQMKLKT